MRYALILLAEFDNEMKTTRTMLEEVPERPRRRRQRARLLRARGSDAGDLRRH